MIGHFFMNFGMDDDNRNDTTIIRYYGDDWFLISIGDSGLFRYRSIHDKHIASDNHGRLFIKGIDMLYDA
jgi:hypothetical protein